MFALLVSDMVCAEKDCDSSDEAKKLASSNGLSSRYVWIGHNQILKSELVEIGDLDGNGAKDFVWMSEKEGHSSGAIRIFLVEKNGELLSTHHVAEDKWGFTAKLRPGDRFGSAVVPIGDIDGDGTIDLAVGAAGDSESGKHAGAVYILLMNCDGAVREYKKISASRDPSLIRQHQENEGFGTEIEALGDLNGDGVAELSVTSSDGGKTLLALESTGKSLGAIKFSKGVDPKDIERPKIIGQVRVMPLRHLGELRSDIDTEDKRNLIAVKASRACFYNETACACDEYVSSSTCLDLKTTQGSRPICSKRPCKSSYRCDCTGKKLCARVPSMQSIYVAEKDEELGFGNEVYCNLTEASVVRMELIPGAQIPDQTEESANVEQTIWTETRCSCSPKTHLANEEISGQCYDFERKGELDQPFCTIRPCKQGQDEMVCDVRGRSVCARGSEERMIYVRKGDVLDDGLVPCSLETKAKETLTVVA